MAEDAKGPSELQAAQQGLIEALSRIPMDPQQAAVGAYINSSLASARISAIAEFLTTTPESDLISPKDRLDALTVKNLTAMRDAIYAQINQASRLAVVKDVPSAVRKALNGH